MFKKTEDSTDAAFPSLYPIRARASRKLGVDNLEKENWDSIDSGFFSGRVRWWILRV